MARKADADAPTAEEIASELNRIANVVRHGPLDAAELTQVIARVEAITELMLHQPGTDPAVAECLHQLAAQLRAAPIKRKNGSTA
jgi:hypothetical protein